MVGKIRQSRPQTPLFPSQVVSWEIREGLSMYSNIYLKIFIFYIATCCCSSIGQAEGQVPERSDDQLEIYTKAFVMSEDWPSFPRTPADYGVRILPFVLEYLEDAEVAISSEEGRVGDGLTREVAIRRGIGSVDLLVRLQGNGDIHGPDHMPKILFFLDSPDYRMRQVATSRLTALGDESYLPICFVLLEDDGFVNRVHAITAIGVHGNAESIPALRLWRNALARELDDPSEEVRATAADLIRRCDLAIEAIQGRLSGN